MNMLENLSDTDIEALLKFESQELAPITDVYCAGEEAQLYLDEKQKDKPPQEFYED